MLNISRPQYDKLQHFIVVMMKLGWHSNIVMIMIMNDQTFASYRKSNKTCKVVGKQGKHKIVMR